MRDYTNSTKRFTILVLTLEWLFVIGLDIVFYKLLSSEEHFAIWYIMLLYPVFVTIVITWVTITTLNLSTRVKAFFGSIF